MNRFVNEAAFVALLLSCPSGVAWGQCAVETFPMTIPSGAQFGHAVAIDGDLLVIGAPRDSGCGPNAGAAYVYREIPSFGWVLDQRLVSSWTTTGDLFGSSVAIQGERIIVGAPQDDRPSLDGGAVYVFDYDVNQQTWVETGEVLLPTSGPWQQGTSDNFGDSVSLDPSGTEIMVGCPLYDPGGSVNQGAVFYFAQQGPTWGLIHGITATNGGADDRFGESVSVEGGNLAVGAPLYDIGGGSNHGAAYTFVEQAGGWVQQAFLTEPIPKSGGFFGFDVAFSGNRMLIGASEQNVTPAGFPGKAYMYQRTGPLWSLEQALVPCDLADDDLFGFAVALDGEVAVVSSANADVAGFPSLDHGAAFVFKLIGGEWRQTARLLAPDPIGGDVFGYDVAVDASVDRIVVGAPGAGIGGLAFLYEGLGNILPFGQGCQGSGPAVPQLKVRNCIHGGETITLSLTDGIPNASSLLLTASSSLTVSIMGCDILGALFPVIPLIPLNVSGEYAVSAQLPASLTPGSVFIQSLILNSGGSPPIAVSNGVQLDLK